MMRFTADSGSPSDLRRCRAFTLIELLTVIAIILILAGLVLGLAGSAQNKAATSRATAEIQALSSAANNYQIDNGTYPRVTKAYNGAITNPTDTLDARTTTPATKVDPTTAAYKESGLALYQLLCGSFYPVSGVPVYYDATSAPTNIAKPTVYYPFKTSQLKNSANVTSGYVDPTKVQAFNDPFGFSYGYSTAYQADIESESAKQAANPAYVPQPPTHGYNPSFDLWSTAGYSATAGKTYPTSVAAASYYTLWVKNW